MNLLEWQYLIFLLPIGLGALYLILMALGLSFGEHAADLGADQDADVSVDQGDLGVDHDVGLDHDVDVDQDVGVDHDVAVEHGDVSLEHAAAAGQADLASEFHPGALDALIGFLGVGKVPLTILLMSYCFIWGGAGLISLTFLGKVAVWPAIGIAAAAAVLVTRHLAAALARLIPSVESYHTPQRQLVGLRGEVLYEVTETSGMVRVRDEQQNLRDVDARVSPGVTGIPAGTSVVLQRYDAATKSFFVKP